MPGERARARLGAFGAVALLLLSAGWAAIGLLPARGTAPLHCATLVLAGWCTSSAATLLRARTRYPEPEEDTTPPLGLIRLGERASG